MATITADPALSKSSSDTPVLPPLAQRATRTDRPLPRRSDWWALLFWLAGAGILVLLHVVDVLVWILRVPR